jgi:predicted negative regulator of RcsB-dependent stress response
MLFTWLAEAHEMLGQPNEALNSLDEGMRLIEATEERVSEAELLHRVRGDLLKGRGDLTAAERSYSQAVIVAERQGANLLQLRASISLARLWRG